MACIPPMVETCLQSWMRPVTRERDHRRACRQGQVTFAAGHEDFRHLGQVWHACSSIIFPTHEASPRSPAGGRPHLEVLARSTGFRCRSVGVSSGWPPHP
jgi:hypothetical protein